VQFLWPPVCLIYPLYSVLTLFLPRPSVSFSFPKLFMTIVSLAQLKEIVAITAQEKKLFMSAVTSFSIIKFLDAFVWEDFPCNVIFELVDLILHFQVDPEISLSLKQSPASYTQVLNASSKGLHRYAVE